MDALSNLGNKLSKPLGFFEKHGYGLGNIATAVSRSGLIPNKYVMIVFIFVTGISYIFIILSELFAISSHEQ